MSFGLVSRSKVGSTALNKRNIRKNLRVKQLIYQKFSERLQLNALDVRLASEN